MSDPQRQDDKRVPPPPSQKQVSFVFETESKKRRHRAPKRKLSEIAHVDAFDNHVFSEPRFEENEEDSDITIQPSAKRQKVTDASSSSSSSSPPPQDEATAATALSVAKRAVRTRGVAAQTNDGCTMEVVQEESDKGVCDTTPTVKYQRDMPYGFQYIASDPSSYFEIYEEHFDNLKSEAATFAYVPQLYESFTQRTYWSRSVRGEETLARFEQTMDEFNYERIDQQMLFHKHMINATLPKIFGNELAAHKERILKEHGWDDIMQEVFVVTPRRFGKTWGVAMYAAAALIAIPSTEVVIFSMALRASRKMLALIDKMINRHEIGSQMMIRPHTQEKLTLRGASASDDERTCLSYPGKSDVRHPSLPHSTPLHSTPRETAFRRAG